MATSRHKNNPTKVLPLETNGGRRDKTAAQKRQKQTRGEKPAFPIQDDVEYADDNTLFIEQDSHDLMCERMGNYDISTETRAQRIQRANVMPLTQAGRGPKAGLPPTFGQIKFRSGVTIIGKEI